MTYEQYRLALVVESYLKDAASLAFMLFFCFLMYKLIKEILKK